MKNADNKYVDMFEFYDELPPDLFAILKKYVSEDCETPLNYQRLADMVHECEAIGYTFEYYLDAVPYGLRPLGVALNELEGYEDL